MHTRDALPLIESFVIVAQELSFRRAAARLSIDRSALTRRIQKLEFLLGFPLLERTTREVALTPAGRTFCERNADLLQDFTESVDAARRIAEGKTGMLRIGYMAFAARHLMPTAVAAFRARHPGVDIRLEYIRTQGQKVALANDEIDVGFLIGPFEHIEFRSATVATEALYAVLPAGHPLRHQPRLVLADLASEQLVLGDLAEWEAYRWHLSDLFNSEGMELRVTLEAPDTPALVGLVSAGLGITICPKSLVGFFDSSVTARRIDHPGARIETVLSWRRTNLSPSVRRFTELALATGNSDPAG